MAFRKDPITIGLLLEAVGSGKGYEVIAEGEQREHWMVRQIGGKGKGMERAATDINDPFKWTRFNLDELPPEEQAKTILGKERDQAEPPAADEPPAEEPPAAPSAERTVEAAFVRPGNEILDELTDQWITVKLVEPERAGSIGLKTSAGERTISFFSRVRVR